MKKKDFIPPIVEEAVIATEDSMVNFDALIKDLQIDLAKDIPRPESILNIGEEIWGTLGNVSVIMGKAKSKKTFFVTAATAAMLSSKTLLGILEGTLPEGKKKILYFDTEQSEYHVQWVARRICNMAGIKMTTENLVVFKLNPIGTKKRLDLINYIMNETELIEGVGVVIIDGVRDLLFDINSSQEATELVDYIRNWTDKNKIHLITILHTNKTDGNLRGHIGTELLNKGETIIELKIDKENKDISIVSCAQSRNKPFDDFAFTINEKAFPEKCDMPKPKASRTKLRPHELSEDAHKEIITAIWEKNGMMTTEELWPEIQMQLLEREWELGRNAVLNFPKYWVTKKWIKNKRKGRANQYVSII